jgi:hypothetical protein
MSQPTGETPQDLGQVELHGVCQVCGAEGPVIAVPGSPPPSAFCPPCAIEYGEASELTDDEAGA